LEPTFMVEGVEAADADIIAPLAVSKTGESTQAVSRAIVPVLVIVPPVKPVPAVTEVRVPVVGVTQAKPLEHRELTVRIWPLEPTAKAAGAEGPEAAIIEPLAVRIEAATMQEKSRARTPELVMVPPVRPVPALTAVTVPLVAVTQFKPLVQVELAARYCPLVPTARATGAAAPVPVISAPLPVTQEQGIAEAVSAFT
jgi:hypothetical protein